MSLSALNSHNTLPLFSPLQTHQKTIFTITKQNHFLKPGFLCFNLFNNRQNLFPKAVVGSSMREDKFVDVKDAALLVSTCITRNLPPALTLDQGLDKIKEAVEELKAKPPSCSSGMYRIQVAVPPSEKAFRWFCCQPESSTAFPLFFLSKEMENPTYKPLALGITRGVFGIGSAVNFKGCFSHGSGEYTAFQGYLPVKSTSSMAYGFIDIKFDTMLSSMKHETGSFYLFIPQIELDEYEDISILLATLAWNDSSICTFSEAVKKFELSFDQVGRCGGERMRSALIKFDTMEERVNMVCMNALLLDGRDLEASTMELRDVSLSSSQFSARLSPTLAISNNMHHRDYNQVSFFKQDFPNINALWASLIVEECTRLGLTYFCIAPGSRSSPLSVAASSHPLTTCIACIDERSLAFHALGYARGSKKPAVIITSSGTAVSNLLPAVVEASQDFVPLLLLTADRPPELHDVGANQAINQVNHFGSFVRHFFSLPAPIDDISARMVLTTIDSAVYMATLSPRGPVHINCHFREPLENSPQVWLRSCLEGLEFWMLNTEPFTSYIPLQHSMTCNNIYGHIAEVLKLIQGANRGLLLFGPIHNVDDIWAALLLAKHLMWPVAVDILSGLRLRKYFSSFLDSKDILFIDQLDHLLLSDSFKDWLQVDVIVQIGSRITSKRISQMLEHSFPCPYILVDEHPSRHDPSHIVTHRIQSTITQFCDCLIKTCAPRISNKWRGFLRGLDMMTAWETSFLISSENSLTEPYAAGIILEALRCESALFLGNSMPIRDANMYGCNWAPCTHSTSPMFSSGLPCHWIQVGANRGASGIDGLISTAIGFAVGCSKRVLCVIGDVSFLHDTNGLAILKQRIRRKPMVIVVINNHGGGIFSQLPVANVTERSILDQFFYTSHDVSIHDLCAAHAVKHVQVQTKIELQDALFTSQQEDADCVIEVESCIDANATFHSNLRKFARQASDHALNILSKLSVTDSTFQGHVIYKIVKMEYSLYRVQLNAPPTSASCSTDTAAFYREGYVITLSLEDGSTGYGEVAPLETHKENLLDIEEQLQFLIHVIEGTTIDYILPLLKGSISSWLWNSLGILPGSISPSVRCGLEMALLSAIATREGCNLLDILCPRREGLSTGPSDVQICALLDSYGSPMDTAFVASALVEEGFTAIKIKVARRADPIEDIAVIQEVRKKVGHHIVIRADANRKWTFSEAVQFACSVKDCCLQYIEEPVRNEDDIIKFCEETGLPVALDETINYSRENPLEVLKKYTHAGIGAVVIKPSIIGGFETAAMVARWAQQHGKMSVVSAAFETGVGLSAYIQFARYLDLQNADICRMMDRKPELSIAHGLGTYRWFKEDVTVEPLNISFAASAVDAGRFLKQCQIDPNMIVKTSAQGQIRKYPLTVEADGFSFSLNILEIGKSIDDTVVVFLHGFLGTGDDWIPIMKALSSSLRCIAIDLPGHGGSKLLDFSQGQSLPMDVVVNMLCKVLHDLTPGKVVLVGYSMGARISLYMALKRSNKVEGAVIISGSPGLTDPDARTSRRAKDDFRACTLVSNGLEFFLDTWYSEELWSSLRSHPHFKQILANRSQHDDLHTLAKVLSDLSIGRQQSLWGDLKNCTSPILLIVGERDIKFKKIAREMYSKMNDETRNTDCPPIIEIPNSGHAVHLENPLPVIAAVSQFLKRLKAS
ncbi:Protein PHYLLO [Abeliophyllum distichum]|uniref:Protein PHYLLO n=1 Tax=Abeliophyllum distichum TaxID=126358 RepID=A0ABD1R8H7_9LAMI